MSETPLPKSTAAPTPAVAAPARGRDPAIESLTRLELVRIAFRQLLAGGWIVAVGVAAHLLLLGKLQASARLIGWLLLLALPAVTCVWLARRFKMATAEEAANPRWGLLLVSAVTVTGAAWGVTPWLFSTLSEPGMQRAAHLLLLAGLTIASMRVLLPMRKGSIAFVVSVMGPVVLHDLVHGDLQLALFATLFIAFTLWSNSRSHRSLSDAIATRFEREALAVELRAEITLRESRESELLEAQEQSTTMSRAKDEFLASISHELRTPMNGVLGMLRILRDTELTPLQKDYIKTASNSAENLMALLNDVIDLAKIEANNLGLESAPFSPAAAARLVADLLQPKASDKGLELSLAIGDQLPDQVLGDVARVRHVLVNLVGNAIKFTERGRVEIKVECPVCSKPGVTLHFTVTDTGIGITSEMLSHLFEPFSQADSSMSRRHGGAGLGLAISTRLAQAMGGSLEAQSMVGQGSTFRLVLPCQVADRPVSPPVPASRFAIPKLQGRVLVVEDDPVNRQVIELFLQKLGVAVKFATDGEAGIAAATSDLPDLVLMDCHLPGLDGLEATRRIRKKLAGKPLKIIAVTAIADPQMHDACLAAGMDDFISKPVRFERLCAVLGQYLLVA